MVQSDSPARGGSSNPSNPPWIRNCNIIAQCNLSFLYRICQTDTPARDIVLYMLQDYVVTGRIIPGTLIARIIDLGIFPMKAAFNKII